MPSETDYNGNTTFYTYDEQGHIIKVAYPDGSDVKYYWCCCQICKYVDATGTSNLSYDALHRLTSMTYSSGKTVTYEYNGIGLVTKITDPDGNNITYAYNTVGGCISMVTSADSQTTTITYDTLRRRSTVTYPTTTNVVTTYTYDNLDRITKISSVAGATTYDLEYTYVTNKDILSQQVIKLNAATVSTIDLTYDSTGRVTEEKVTKAGPTVTYDKQYTYDKVSRRLSVKDVTNGNWLETSTFDTSGRLTRIVVAAGTGSNPFSWPKGTTNVTCDANGNITQLVGRDVDTGAIWKVAHQFDYEQRVIKILLNNGDTVDNVYDGMGYRQKETTTSGGTPTPKNFVPILGNRVIQERDGSDTVTARYYWLSGQFFKKDHSTSSKYFVPEIANSPFTGWNNAGTFNRYDLWDTFGVKEDESGAGSLSPFQLFASVAVDSTHLLLSPNNSSAYPEVGALVDGFFSLMYWKWCCPFGGKFGTCCGNGGGGGNGGGNGGNGGGNGGGGGGGCDACDAGCCCLLACADTGSGPPCGGCKVTCGGGSDPCKGKDAAGGGGATDQTCGCLRRAKARLCKKKGKKSGQDWSKLCGGEDPCKWPLRETDCGDFCYKLWYYGTVPPGSGRIPWECYNTCLATCGGEAGILTCQSMIDAWTAFEFCVAGTQGAATLHEACLKGCADQLEKLDPKPSEDLIDEICGRVCKHVGQ